MADQSATIVHHKRSSIFRTILTDLLRSCLPLSHKWRYTTALCIAISAAKRFEEYICVYTHTHTHRHTHIVHIRHPKGSRSSSSFISPLLWYNGTLRARMSKSVASARLITQFLWLLLLLSILFFQSFKCQKMVIGYYTLARVYVRHRSWCVIQSAIFQKLNDIFQRIEFLCAIVFNSFPKDPDYIITGLDK